MERPRPIRTTLRGLMLLIALSALLLAGGIAVWEWIESMRDAGNPWRNTQAAAARARKAALATASERADSYPDR